MSLKAIEMQIAIPRTQEAGKIQEQFEQRSQLQVHQAENEVLSDVERKRSTVMSQERKEKAAFDSKQGRNGHTKEHGGKQNQKRKEENVQIYHHPYKGKAIDFSG
ncbi:hypothetical protein [Peribacillus sp. SCS-155]|uniref:hypothetical protein n=1 Tax=Peribacillus sedimenti TaxID=3115297 RepID=UPI003906509E